MLAYLWTWEHVRIVPTQGLKSYPTPELYRCGSVVFTSFSVLLRYKCRLFWNWLKYPFIIALPAIVSTCSFSDSAFQPHWPGHVFKHILLLFISWPPHMFFLLHMTLCILYWLALLEVSAWSSSAQGNVFWFHPRMGCIPMMFSNRTLGLLLNILSQIHNFITRMEGHYSHRYNGNDTIYT